MATPPKNPTDGTKPPAPRKPATPRKIATRKTAAAAVPPKTAGKSAAATPATAKPTAPAVKKRVAKAPAVKTATAKKPAAKCATGKTTAKPSGAGRKWGIAAVVGGVGAAVTAGLLALKGSTPTVDEAKPLEGRKAHQPDGTDSSDSFEAGIADESTIPE